MSEETQYSCVSFHCDIFDFIFKQVQKDPNFAKPFIDKYLYHRNTYSVITLLCNYPQRQLPGIESTLYYNTKARVIRLYTPIPKSSEEYNILDDEIRRDVDWVRNYSLNGVELRTLEQCKQIFDLPK